VASGGGIPIYKGKEQKGELVEEGDEKDPRDINVGGKSSGVTHAQGVQKARQVQPEKKFMI